jgi:hypothetical protein
MCLTRYPSWRSLHKDDAALLSHLICTGPPNKESADSKAISPSALRKDIPSLAAATHALYPASVLGAAVPIPFAMPAAMAPVFCSVPVRTESSAIIYILPSLEYLTILGYCIRSSARALCRARTAPVATAGLQTCCHKTSQGSQTATRFAPQPFPRFGCASPASEPPPKPPSPSSWAWVYLWAQRVRVICCGQHSHTTQTVPIQKATHCALPLLKRIQQHVPLPGLARVSSQPQCSSHGEKKFLVPMSLVCKALLSCSWAHCA